MGIRATTCGFALILLPHVSIAATPSSIPLEPIVGPIYEPLIENIVDKLWDTFFGDEKKVKKKSKKKKSASCAGLRAKLADAQAGFDALEELYQEECSSDGSSDGDDDTAPTDGDGEATVFDPTEPDPFDDASPSDPWVLNASEAECRSVRRQMNRASGRIRNIENDMSDKRCSASWSP